jgi:hypothetical protein
VRHQGAPGDQLLRKPPDQRGFPISSRREQDDVLAVAGVGRELGELGLAIGEGVVERQRTEAERIRRRIAQAIYGRACESIRKVALRKVA